MSLLSRVSRVTLTAARPTFAAAPRIVARPAVAAVAVRRFAAAASKPVQAAHPPPSAAHAAAGGHHDDHHDHHGPKPDGEDAESHTYAGLTLSKPKAWQTYGAHFFGGLLWFWLIYRMKNDYKIFFMLEHPWDSHGDHGAHGHDDHHAAAGHGHDDAHDDAHEEKAHH